jgi:hypothetical protein
MEIKCNTGKSGCKYRGDIVDVCIVYVQGSSNGESIIANTEFPNRCKDCKYRDVDFCMRYGDVLCFANQDPFECKVDLLEDKIYGQDLIKKSSKALTKARRKRNWHYNPDR